MIDISNLLILFDDESWEDYECQKSIVRNVYNISSPITDLFQDFFEENPLANVTFYANTSLTSFGSTFPAGGSNYNITFGDPFIFSTDLMMATVTAHEVLHANLYHLYEIRNNDADSSNDITIEGLMTGEEPSYTQLINTWAILETDSMDAQHDYIANYKNEIAQSVYNWAVEPSPFGGGQDPNDTTLLPYLKQLAWVGLEDTSAWENLTDDPNNQALVAEIETTIQQETDPYQTDNEKGNPCE